MDKCYGQNAVLAFLHFSLSLAPLAHFPQSFSLQQLSSVYYQDLLPLFIQAEETYFTCIAQREGKSWRLKEKVFPRSYKALLLKDLAKQERTTWQEDWRAGGIA